MSEHSLRAPALLLPAFLLSGFAALTYEMSWVRQLVSLFGVTYFAITTILTVFMAGLALGAFAAGRLVDRWRVSPLLAFVGLEIFLAVYAQLFPHALGVVEGIYLWVVEGRDLSFTAHAVLRFVFGVLILLPPALASGATLPAASKAFVREDIALGRGVSLLYGANVLGACIGCLGTTFYFIGIYGYPATAWIGSGANLIAAALVLWVHRSSSRIEAPEPQPAAAATPWLSGAKVVGAAYFTVGFCALGAELLWTRVFSQLGFNPATYVFGFVLVSYLAGHGLGAGVVYGWLERRLAPHRMFVALLATSSVLAVLSALALIPRMEFMVPVGFLRGLGLVLPAERVWLIIPAIVIPAICSGALFPLASRLSISGVSGLGTGVGTLSALSTFGGIVGSFFTGFWLMPTLGAVRCLFMVAGMMGMAAVWSWWALRPAEPSGDRPRQRAMVASGLVVATTAGLMLLVPPHVHLLLFPGEDLVAFREGRNSSTAVVDHPTGKRYLLTHGERVLGGGSDVDLAVEIHPSVDKALVIGLGTGRVAANGLARPEIDELTAVDFNGKLPELIPLVLPLDSQLFEHERFNFVENDGRHFLLTTGERYDLIVNDAALYAWYLELSTLEFNRLAASRMAPEGLFLGRLHMWRITDYAFRRELATFIEVFPNAALWKLSEDIAMLVGRKGSAPVDQRDPTMLPGKTRSVLWYDAEQLAELAAGAELITDDHPLHVPYTFQMKDHYPIIEYTSPSALF
jgi:spermidine synthase